MPQDMSMEPARHRIIVLDILRGIAITGVVIYHFAFDLRLLEFIAIDVTYHSGWVFYARTLSTIFLVLTGINLVQAHPDTIRWPAFWRRFVVVAGAALAISLVTYLAYPDMYVYFGILHAIAAFSLLALPFLRMPIWFVAAAAFSIIAAPYFYSDELFNTRLFSVFGFWVTPPRTGDLVPLFPSFGLVLLGLAAARWAIGSNLVQHLGRYLPTSILPKVLAKAGRLSLIIYLVHQPILLAGLYPLAALTNPGEQSRDEMFFGSCYSSCVETSGNAPICQAYCQCSMEQVEAGDLWDIINAPEQSPEQSEAMNSIIRLCQAMTE